MGGSPRRQQNSGLTPVRQLLNRRRVKCLEFRIVSGIIFMRTTLNKPSHDHEDMIALLLLRGDMLSLSLRRENREADRPGAPVME